MKTSQSNNSENPDINETILNELLEHYKMLLETDGDVESWEAFSERIKGLTGDARTAEFRKRLADPRATSGSTHKEIYKKQTDLPSRPATRVDWDRPENLDEDDEPTEEPFVNIDGQLVPNPNPLKLGVKKQNSDDSYKLTIRPEQDFSGEDRDKLKKRAGIKTTEPLEETQEEESPYGLNRRARRDLSQKIAAGDTSKGDAIAYDVGIRSLQKTNPTAAYKITSDKARREMLDDLKKKAGIVNPPTDTPEDPMEEETVTGAVAPTQTPKAFRGTGDKLKNKRDDKRRAFERRGNEPFGRDPHPQPSKIDQLKEKFREHFSGEEDKIWRLNYRGVPVRSLLQGPRTFIVTESVQEKPENELASKMKRLNEFFNNK